MSSEIPQKIGIITVSEEKKLDTEGTRSSEDFGGTLGSRSEITTEIVGIQRTEIELEKLKAEMKGFIGAMREILDEADPPNSQMRLEEVELSVEVNGEGKVSLLGIGGKAGGKGAMTFKFKRKDG
ncbi:Pepco domain-containing protein [Crocosphaera sp. Alani8]|uniref:Pepco domain-containing protein n=1 Tax=Crocosphaera sp. Alani8 TaxID=3038952 RepID=UPI00313D566C